MIVSDSTCSNFRESTADTTASLMVDCYCIDHYTCHYHFYVPPVVGVKTPPTGTKYDPFNARQMWKKQKRTKRPLKQVRHNR